MPYAVLDPSTAAASPTTTAGAPLTSVGETLASIKAELLLQLGNRDDLTASRQNMWINWAYRNVCGMLTLKELFGSLPIAIVASQPFYSIPVQVAWVKRFGVIDTVDYGIAGGREFEMIDEASYRILPDFTDEPSRYFRHRRMLVVWPTPLNNRTAPLDFRVRPDDLVNGTDSPLLPIEFHEPILLSARYRALRSLLNWKDAAVAQNDFVSCIKPLLNTDAEESVGQFSVVAPKRSKTSLFRAEHSFRTRNDL